MNQCPRCCNSKIETKDKYCKICGFNLKQELIHKASAFGTKTLLELELKRLEFYERRIKDQIKNTDLVHQILMTLEEHRYLLRTLLWQFPQCDCKKSAAESLEQFAQQLQQPEVRAMLREMFKEAICDALDSNSELINKSAISTTDQFVCCLCEEETGELEIDNGKRICHSCAQIQSELGHEQSLSSKTNN